MWPLFFLLLYTSLMFLMMMIIFCYKVSNILLYLIFLGSETAMSFRQIRFKWQWRDFCGRIPVCYCRLYQNGSEDVVWTLRYQWWVCKCYCIVITDDVYEIYIHLNNKLLSFYASLCVYLCLFFIVKSNFII